MVWNITVLLAPRGLVWRSLTVWLSMLHATSFFFFFLFLFIILCTPCTIFYNKYIARLVNGATGPVTGFDGRPIDNELNITSVNVWFENAPQSVQIERQSTTSEVPNSVYHTQKQFLLILAFAITIHKSQGLSMKTAIVDAGPNCFRIGMM